MMKFKKMKEIKQILKKNWKIKSKIAKLLMKIRIL